MGSRKGKGAVRPIDPHRLLFEDNHLVAVLKEPGELVQGDRSGDPSLDLSVEEYIRVHYQKPGNVYLGVIHRIDRPVSGVLLFAKTGKGLSRMNQAFQEKKVEKTYWAVVEGIHSGTGRFEDRLIKDERKNRSRIVEGRPKGSRNAILSYEVIGTGDRYSLLQVHPETGRHHQIRVQLADRNMPIKGDVKYGAHRPNKDASIHLHARSIRFPHPTQASDPCIEAPPPEGDPLWKLFLEKRKGHS